MIHEIASSMEDKVKTKIKTVDFHLECRGGAGVSNIALSGRECFVAFSIFNGPWIIPYEISPYNRSDPFSAIRGLLFSQKRLS